MFKIVRPTWQFWTAIWQSVVKEGKVWRKIIFKFSRLLLVILKSFCIKLKRTEDLNDFKERQEEEKKKKMKKGNCVH
jgi:hypothetical protein